MGEWGILSQLLDKVQSYSTVFGKVWMSVLFLFRIFILAAAVDNVWGGEQGDMDCNSRSIGCKNTCYDRSFPLSHTRFWVLQILTVSTPTLVHLGHVLLIVRKENKMRKRLQDKMAKSVKLPKYSDEYGNVRLKGELLVSYMIQLVMKTLLEVGFIVGQYYLYSFILMPSKVICTEQPCKNAVDCFINRPTEKNIFIIFMLTMAGLSVVLSIVEMLHLVTSKIKRRKRRNSGSDGQELRRLDPSQFTSVGRVTLC